MDWSPKEIADAAGMLGLTMVSIIAGAFVLGKWADAMKAKWSK